MGKSKKRIFNKNKIDSIAYMKREQAIDIIINALNTKSVTPEIENIIDLFGITQEELADKNIKFEDLKNLYPI